MMLSYFRKLFLLATVLGHCQLAAEDTKISERMSVREISDGVYMHSSGGDNGMVVISNGEALAVSTPASDDDTRVLIGWITGAKDAKLIGFVVDRWHPDAMGGIDAVHEADVISFAFSETTKIARARGLTVPKMAFENRIEISVGEKVVVLDYLGRSHTTDGIVAWVPEDRVLFGGNSVRNAGGWAGNIGDARVSDWSDTIRHVKERYGSALHVIPGHGDPAGVDLLDYTIDLYEQFAAQTPGSGGIYAIDCSVSQTLVVESAAAHKSEGDVHRYDGATLVLHDSYKAVRVRAAALAFRQTDNRLTSPSGLLEIFDKEGGNCRHRITVSFDRLVIVDVNESVGFAVVVKSASPAAFMARPFSATDDITNNDPIG